MPGPRGFGALHTRGAGLHRADCDTPNRHMNAWQRGTGLVDDGPTTAAMGCAAVEPATQKGIAAASNNFMVRRKMYVLAQSKALGTSHPMLPV